MNEILVTGGLGYIGSHSVKALKENGYKVVIVDSAKENTNKLDGATVYHIDILDKNLLKEVFSKHKFGSVLHFAGLISVGESVNKPDIYYENNFVGSMNLLNLMRDFGVKNIVFSSTAAVYGNPESKNIDESHPLKPISPYGKSKLMIEWLIEDYSNAYGINYVNLRYFNASGADKNGKIGERHDPETHLIPLLLHAAEGKIKNFKLYGDDYETPDGSCIRDFIHVTDLAIAHVKALNYLKTKGAEKVFNLGTGRGYSVKEVIAATEKVLNKKLPVQIEKRRDGDSAQLVANASKAEKILGIKNEYSDLENIIKTAHNFLIKNF